MKAKQKLLFTLVREHVGEMLEQLMRVDPTISSVEVLSYVMAIISSSATGGAEQEFGPKGKNEAITLFRELFAAYLILHCFTREQAHLVIEAAWTKRERQEELTRASVPNCTTEGVG